MLRNSETPPPQIKTKNPRIPSTLSTADKPRTQSQSPISPISQPNPVWLSVIFSILLNRLCPVQRNGSNRSLGQRWSFVDGVECLKGVHHLHRADASGVRFGGLNRNPSQRRNRSFSPNEIRMSSKVINSLHLADLPHCQVGKNGWKDDTRTIVPSSTEKGYSANKRKKKWKSFQCNGDYPSLKSERGRVRFRHRDMGHHAMYCKLLSNLSKHQVLFLVIIMGKRFKVSICEGHGIIYGSKTISAFSKFKGPKSQGISPNPNTTPKKNSAHPCLVLVSVKFQWRFFSQGSYNLEISIIIIRMVWYASITGIRFSANKVTILTGLIYDMFYRFYPHNNTILSLKDYCRKSVHLSKTSLQNGDVVKGLIKFGHPAIACYENKPSYNFEFWMVCWKMRGCNNTNFFKEYGRCSSIKAVLSTMEMFACFISCLLYLNCCCKTCFDAVVLLKSYGIMASDMYLFIINEKAIFW